MLLRLTYNQSVITYICVAGKIFLKKHEQKTRNEKCRYENYRRARYKYATVKKVILKLQISNYKISIQSLPSKKEEDKTSPTQNTTVHFDPFICTAPTTNSNYLN